MKRELNYALQSDHYNERIVAVIKTRGDYTDLSWTLSSIQNIDFSGAFHGACVGLLRVWGVVYRAD